MTEKSLQQKFISLKQSIIFDIFVPENTLTSYIKGLTKQFYLQLIISRFDSSYLSTKLFKNTGASEYMFLEHLENLVLQGRLGEALIALETQGSQNLKESHRKEFEIWAKEVKRREYIIATIEAFRKHSDEVAEKGIQELKR
jgi:hypothetical protein